MCQIFLEATSQFRGLILKYVAYYCLPPLRTLILLETELKKKKSHSNVRVQVKCL